MYSSQLLPWALALSPTGDDLRNLWCLYINSLLLVGWGLWLAYLMLCHVCFPWAKTAWPYSHTRCPMEKTPIFPPKKSLACRHTCSGEKGKALKLQFTISKFILSGYLFSKGNQSWTLNKKRKNSMVGFLRRRVTVPNGHSFPKL